MSVLHACESCQDLQRKLDVAEKRNATALEAIEKIIERYPDDYTLLGYVGAIRYALMNGEKIN